ncbi:hypothetical protein [Chitinophaga arvensicola]|uniref:Uncharacterized protein n=1 Tax=Chitinophaga arvensicola TaxID=29529 RepID=A0A1I0SC36_9BACT|nr:hypothetical protein [Chitinophaga arvensicola]SEW54252.1 hypothetical protein SAMN04488122_5975 [Chitinophaga arvensicola]
MFSGLTPTSRQRKFCEGFLFFPIRHLRKYGNFIFRQYGRHAGVKTLLDMQLGIAGYDASHTDAIVRCITDTAAPQVASVMSKVEDFYTRIQAEAGSSPVLFGDFTNIVIHFYREVSIYHNVILRNLKQELQPAGKSNKNAATLSEAGQDHINKVQKVVKEFVLQCKTMVNALEEMAQRDHYSPMDESYLQATMALMGDIRQMARHQQHLSQLLKKWVSDKNLHVLQTYYN